MGKDLYDAYPAAKAVFDKADSLLGFPFDRVSRGIDFGRLNLLGSICGELISVPDYYAEAGEKIYRNAGNELDECIKNGKLSKSDVLADYIDEFLAMAEGITDKQSDKWREYAEYFRTEVTGNE